MYMKKRGGAAFLKKEAIPSNRSTEAKPVPTPPTPSPLATIQQEGLVANNSVKSTTGRLSNEEPKKSWLSRLFGGSRRRKRRKTRKTRRK